MWSVRTGGAQTHQSATQNLNVHPALVSLFTFRHFITPCTGSGAERQRESPHTSSPCNQWGVTKQGRGSAVKA